MKLTVPPYPPLASYALIGDCRSGALVSLDGAIEWMCWPRFDSPSVFGSILDAERGGHFTIRPTGPYRATRRYREDTNVLETTFQGETGRVRLVDCMPVTSEAQKRRELWPEHQLIRWLEGVEGELEMEVLCAPRPNYGSTTPRLRDRGFLGIYYEDAGLALVLRSDIPLALSESSSDVSGSATIRAGDRRAVSLVLSDGEPGILASIGEEAARKIAVSEAWWKEWIRRCAYKGPYQHAVRRSALTLKLLCFAPSGALVAAPTTSLPEKIGGVRNWDYRFCWLRDSSLTIQALFDLGYNEEAEAFLAWLIHTTRVTRPELQVLYSLYGEPKLPERALDHLAGYRGSRPVRIGNAASGQFQLDVYGEVVDAAFAFGSRGGVLDPMAAALLVGYGKTVCRRWREPDQGIWESRGEPRHYTYSKAMCWVTLDRLLRLAEAGLLRVPGDLFRRERDCIRREIETRGFNERLGYYTSVLDGDDVDASLVLLTHFGFDAPDSARMRATMSRIQERLGVDGLIFRYRGQDDSLPPGEGAFGICSFWAVGAEARAGDLAGATRRFEDLLRYANDVGLYAEEIEPGSGAALGNFPQAFTHVGLVDAALTLEDCTAGTQRGKPVGADGKGKV